MTAIEKQVDNVTIKKQAAFSIINPPFISTVLLLVVLAYNRHEFLQAQHYED